jgi:hypothetical protein
VPDLDSRTVAVSGLSNADHALLLLLPVPSITAWIIGGP